MTDTYGSDFDGTGATGPSTVTNGDGQVLREDPMDQGDLEPYGERPEVAVEGAEVVHGAELPQEQDPNQWFDVNEDGTLTHKPPEPEPVTYKQGGVAPGTFSRALGMPIEGEDGSGIEVARTDLSDAAAAAAVLADLESKDSVSISLWRGTTCTTLDQSWDSKDAPADAHVTAFRTLSLAAEEILENDRQ